MEDIKLPQPTDAFDWVQAAGGPALRCGPLAHFAPHLFTTRVWPLGSAASAESDAAWHDVVRALGSEPDRLARLHQVHGARAVVADAASRPDADIVISRDASLVLAVQTADCIPLLLADERNGAVAVVHAGWRGLAARAPIVAVEALAREFGSRSGDLMAAVGPSIGACCYEVGEDVRARFDENGFAHAEIDTWFGSSPRPTPRNPSISRVSSTRRQDRWYFDAWSATRDQLQTVGVQASRIHIAELCTASHTETFCSYRRDGARSGRIAGAIRAATIRVPEKESERM